MLTGQCVIAACLLLLHTQGGAGTATFLGASRSQQRQEVMEKSAAAVEVLPGQDTGLGAAGSAANLSDSAGPGLAMEPLPEDYTATQEKKIISTYWQVLQKRRMKSLLACETTLWEIMGQTVNVTHKEGTPTQTIPDPRQTQAADDMMADSQGRHVVDVTEAALEKCYREVSLRAGRTDPHVEIHENLLREIHRILDQVEACRAAGGKSPPTDTTRIQLDQIKTQSDNPSAHPETMSVLQSLLVSVSLDKQLCLESLPLPANQYISLE